MKQKGRGRVPGELRRSPHRRPSSSALSLRLRTEILAAKSGVCLLPVAWEKAGREEESVPLQT